MMLQGKGAPRGRGALAGPCPDICKGGVIMLAYAKALLSIVLLPFCDSFLASPAGGAFFLCALLLFPALFLVRIKNFLGG